MRTCLNRLPCGSQPTFSCRRLRLPSAPHRRPGSEEANAKESQRGRLWYDRLKRVPRNGSAVDDRNHPSVEEGGVRPNQQDEAGLPWIDVETGGEVETNYAAAARSVRCLRILRPVD